MRGLPEAPAQKGLAEHDEKRIASAESLLRERDGGFLISDCRRHVCSYMPTPTQSSTRLQFGVNADAMRFLRFSPMAPAGTNLPPPEKQ
jgi:hypothetical protein